MKLNWHRKPSYSLSNTGGQVPFATKLSKDSPLLNSFQCFSFRWSSNSSRRNLSSWHRGHFLTVHRYWRPLHRNGHRSDSARSFLWRTRILATFWSRVLTFCWSQYRSVVFLIFSIVLSVQLFSGPGFFHSSSFILPRSNSVGTLKRWYWKSSLHCFWASNLSWGALESLASLRAALKYPRYFRNGPFSNREMSESPVPMLRSRATLSTFWPFIAATSASISSAGLLVPKPPSPNFRFPIRIGLKYEGAAVVARAASQIGTFAATPGFLSLLIGGLDPQWS